MIAVVIPEVVQTHWWQVLLHNHRAARLRSALMRDGDSRFIVVSVPWYPGDECEVPEHGRFGRAGRGGEVRVVGAAPDREGPGALPGRVTPPR